MSDFGDRLADYDRIHRIPVNRASHAVGIPMIEMSVLGLVGMIHGPLPVLNGATLLIAVSFAVMMTYSLRAAILQSLFALLLAAVAGALVQGQPSLVAVSTFIVLFAVGWVIQFVGHAFERQPPDFVRTPLNLLLGPLFVLNELFRVLPDQAEGQRP